MAFAGVCISGTDSLAASLADSLAAMSLWIHWSCGIYTVCWRLGCQLLLSSSGEMSLVSSHVHLPALNERTVIRAAPCLRTLREMVKDSQNLPGAPLVNTGSPQVLAASRFSFVFRPQLNWVFSFLEEIINIPYHREAKELEQRHDEHLLLLFLWVFHELAKSFKQQLCPWTNNICGNFPFLL